MAALSDNSPESWLHRTGQRWKYMVFCVLVLVAMIFFAAMVVDINTSEDPRMLYGLVAAAAGAAAIGWLGTSIRCPRCRGRVAWWIVTHSSSEEWLTDLTDARECAVCGDDGAD
jgi:hypothetical protein